MSDTLASFNGSFLFRDGSYGQEPNFDVHWTLCMLVLPQE